MKTLSRHAVLRAVAVVALGLLPTCVAAPLARACGHRIAPGVRIGFSLLLSRRIYLDADTRIGHLNLVSTDRLVLRKDATIGHLNLCTGPFSILLKPQAALGNRNHLTRAARGIVHGPSQLVLGVLSKISAQHRLDLTASILLGHHTQLAGSGTQIWTHGYIHDPEGPSRYRIDGAVRLGNNVSIGSRALLTGGARVGSNITVGAGATVTGRLEKPGLYVTPPLRHLPPPADPDSRIDLVRVADAALVDTVFRKVSAD